MERTGRLLGIALAVLALDGCRGPSQQSQAQPTGSPGTAGHTATSHFHGGGVMGAAAAYGALHGSRNRAGMSGTATVDRTLGGNRGRAGGISRGGFGSAGAHGGGG